MSPLSQFARRKACVVLPTYNERNNLRVVLPLIFDQAARIETHDLHVLVVDDNSPDGTADVVREAMSSNPKLHLITGKKRGLGEAYQRGMAHAVEQLGASLLLEMDADGQHDPALIPEFIRLCVDGDRRLVIGSRFLPGSSMPEFGPARRGMSSVGSFLVRLCGGVGPVSDCTSGYRCFPAELFSGCDFSKLPTRGYSFQTAILFELVRQGAEIVEIPLLFAPRLDGESKLKMRDCIEFVVTLGGLMVRRLASASPATVPLPAAHEATRVEIVGRAVQSRAIQSEAVESKAV
ncbi:MAG: polyprenol monophosphomannose synthase [Terriglobales bacterium]